MIATFSRLSPRRRALVGVVMLLILFAAVIAAVRLSAGDPAPPAQDLPGTVVLMPGYGGGTRGLAVLADRLRQAGRTAEVVQAPGGDTGDLADQARALDRRVTAVLRAGAPSVDVIGYSAGGVVARVWARDHGGAGKARRIVTLGSPHRGTDLAAAGGALVPGACPEACRQLAPGSALLARLGDRAPEPPEWMSIWTTLDETVRPPETARLAGAVNVPLQSICAEARTNHGGLPTDPDVTAIVLRALGPGPLSAPTACPTA